MVIFIENVCLSFVFVTAWNIIKYYLPISGACENNNLNKTKQKKKKYIYIYIYISLFLDCYFRMHLI